MRPIERTNDFVVKFANVNGSGSASANGLFGNFSTNARERARCSSFNCRPRAAAT